MYVSSGINLTRYLLEYIWPTLLRQKNKHAPLNNKLKWGVGIICVTFPQSSMIYSQRKPRSYFLMFVHRLTRVGTDMFRNKNVVRENLNEIAHPLPGILFLPRYNFVCIVYWQPCYLPSFWNRFVPQIIPTDKMVNNCGSSLICVIVWLYMNSWLVNLLWLAGFRPPRRISTTARGFSGLHD